MPFGMVGQVGWWMTFNGGWVLGAHVALQHESPTLTLMPNPSPNITHTHTHTHSRFTALWNLSGTSQVSFSHFLKCLDEEGYHFLAATIFSHRIMQFYFVFALYVSDICSTLIFPGLITSYLFWLCRQE